VVDKEYLKLCQYILDNGIEKEDRTGVGTKSVFGYQMKFDLSEGFPLLTTKKVNFNLVWSELLWFIKGDTNIKFLLENKNLKTFEKSTRDRAVTVSIPGVNILTSTPASLILKNTSASDNSYIWISKSPIVRLPSYMEIILSVLLIRNAGYSSPTFFL